MLLLIHLYFILYKSNIYCILTNKAMKPEAALYVKNQLARASDRLKHYVESPGWTYAKRPGFYRIDKYIRDFLGGERESRWVIIPGLRGVGKTTVLAQLFFKCKKALKDKHVLYISVDDIVTAGLTLSEVLEEYERILGKSFEAQSNPVILFIDEVQQDKKWAAVLKSMYDKARNVFVVCTGSSAVQLQTNADVARRGIFEKLYPLNFSEYEMLKRNKFPEPRLKQSIKDAIYDSSSASEVHTRLGMLDRKIATQWAKFEENDLDEFLSTGTLPFTFRAQDVNIHERIGRLIDRMIAKDIPEMGKFDLKTLAVIKKLLFIMADSNDGFSINKASSILGIERITLTAVLDALEKAEIIIRIPPHGSSAVAVRKPSKYLFMSPAIRMSLLSITGLDETFLARKGKLLEDVSALHFYREFVSSGAGGLTYDTAGAGADFILQITNKKQIAIEIGMGDKDFSQVKNTMDKVRCDYGLIFCASNAINLSEKDNIIKIPHRYFLLM